MTALPGQTGGDGLVLVLDDDASVRQALANLLQSVGLAVRPFATAAELDAIALPEVPVCLVLDVRMPGRNGLDIHDDVRRRWPALPVIFLTGHGDIPMSVRAMKSGAIEFLTKPFREQDLLDAIHTGLAASRANLDRLREIDALQRRHAALSPREREVMALIVEGQLSKQIAARLALSEITVKVCRAALMKKLGATTLVELGVIAERLGQART